MNNNKQTNNSDIKSEKNNTKTSIHDDNNCKHDYPEYDYLEYGYSEYNYSEYDDFGINSSGARGGGKNNNNKTDVKKNKNISCYSSKHVRKMNNTF